MSGEMALPGYPGTRSRYPGYRCPGYLIVGARFLQYFAIEQRFNWNSYPVRVLSRRFALTIALKAKK
eukprot:3409180-Rhodomonas_salina.1